MLSTWIEAAAKGRLGGPVRAGMWSSVVVGTHPIEANQDVWLELTVDEVAFGPLPAYWIENKGANSFWHVPLPPQGVGKRLHYRSGVRRLGGETEFSAYQDAMVRPNLPDRSDSADVVTLGAEGLVGNRMMTARVDARGSTHDVYYPTVGLHSDVRPAEGDLPQSRSHFRTIVGGLAIGRRLDWFAERLTWEAFQHYQGATNLLTTELSWRNGPVKVIITDFAAGGGTLPKTEGGIEAPGQYIKRFRIKNEGRTAVRALFGVYIQAEVNGGIGEPGLSWHDGDATLLAINRGHGHANRKLARDATVEFAIALDNRGPVHCEPTGPNEAMLLRWLDLPEGEPVTVDLIISGAFTGWRGDPGTFEHWLRPALSWFRNADLEHVEQATALDWDAYVEPLPTVQLPRPAYGVHLRRSALAMALHADANWGAVASGFERGLSAYCWPREAILAGVTFDRLGHPEITRGIYQWLWRVRGQNRRFSYWFQKYTIDGFPEWETPAVDQSALIPWGLEQHFLHTGDLNLVISCWPMIEQAVGVACGESGHPGLRFRDDLRLISSAGIWGYRYGAFLYSNCCVVAGLRAAARLAERVDKLELARQWNDLADTIWEMGILGEAYPEQSDTAGLFDPSSGRFLDGRCVSSLPALWTDNPALTLNRSTTLDVSMLAMVVPLGLIRACDSRVTPSVEAILKASLIKGEPNVLSRWSQVSRRHDQDLQAQISETQLRDVSSLATLWMARYLIAAGRESGQARYWNNALAMLDAVIARMTPLGLSMRTLPRTGDIAPRQVMASGVWHLHAMLVETLLDFTGLDYNTVDRRLTLEPALPTSWPQTGHSQPYDCGDVAYRLERPIGGNVYQLSLKTNLKHPVTLLARVTCPGLTRLGPWQSSPDSPTPEFNAANGQVRWTTQLPAGETSWSWTWG